MAERNSYRTRQKDELRSYLQSIQGEHRTAAQIKEHFQNDENAPGMTTIYRQLENLVKEGVVRKYNLENRDSACYEYVGEQEHNSRYIHCKCEKCGKLIHMDASQLDAFGQQMLNQTGFVWNMGRTVFYGVCDACRGKTED